MNIPLIKIGYATLTFDPFWEFSMGIGVSGVSNTPRCLLLMMIAKSTGPVLPAVFVFVHFNCVTVHVHVVRFESNILM